MGYHLQKLRCEYRVSIPSLEIHVKGVECEDITPVTPPLPVVTSCGVVLLYHDHEAGLVTFISKSHSHTITVVKHLLGHDQSFLVQPVILD